MYGSEYAYLFPQSNQTPLDTFWQIKKYQDEQKDRERQIKLQEEQRQAGMAKYLADSLDFNTYATGTEYDPVFRSTANDILSKGAEMIKKGSSYPELISYIGSAAKQLGDYSQKAKLLDQQMKAQAQEYAKNKSINANALYKQMKLAAFHDGNGGMKNIADIDPNQDYGAYVIDKYPDLVLDGSGTGSLDDILKNQKYMDYEKQSNITKNGIQRIVGYKGKYSPFHELIDDKGNVVDGNGFATGVRVRGEKVKIGDKEFTAVPENVYNTFTSDAGAKAYLNAQAKRLKANYPDAKEDDLKRVVLHDYLSQSGTGYINNVKNEIDPSQAESRRHQETMAAIHASNKSNSQQPTPINDVVGRIKQMYESNPNRNWLGVNALGADDQAILMNYVNSVSKKAGEGGTLVPNTQGDVAIVRTTDGGFAIAEAENGQVKKDASGKAKVIMPLSGYMQKAQAGTKAKQAVVSKTNQGKPKDPLGLF